MNPALDGHGYIAGDVALAMLITLSAIVTYARVAFEMGALRWPVPRMVIGVGFSIWAIRFWYALATGSDILIAPISMIAVAMITGGYSSVQLLGIRRAIAISRNPVYCLQSERDRCLREDRLRDAWGSK